MVEDLLPSWDGEEVLTRHDVDSGATIHICIHSTVLGPAAGGTRLKVYSTPEDALLDGLRLAKAMTRKNAVAGLPLGGGKAVLSVPEIPFGEDRYQLFRHYGRILTELGGRYRTACDMNTTTSDMDVIAETSPYVFGRSEAAGGSGTSAPATAVGVFNGIRAALSYVFGSPDPGGRRVAIQGVGAVGSLLAQHLSDAGSEVIVADADPLRAEEVALIAGGRAVDADEILEVACDVVAPCAIGGVLTPETIEHLDCRIVAGAANNQLATELDGERFMDRGIVYVPDFVVNAGGIIHLASRELLGEDERALDARLAAIGTTVSRVLEIADREHVSTERAASAIVEERIATGRR